MQEAADAVPSGMVSILGLERQQVQDLCDEAREAATLEIANLLCPGNIAVSGTRDACARVADLAVAAGAMRAIPLTVAGGFQHPLMEPAARRLQAALEETSFRRPTMAVVFNVDAEPHDAPEEIRQLLARQLVTPVRWEDSVRHLLAEGFDRFYEVGPGRVLRGPARTDSASCLLSYSRRLKLQTPLSWIDVMPQEPAEKTDPSKSPLGVDLTGQLAIVTGASRGIGQTIANRLAHAGAALSVLHAMLSGLTRQSARSPPTERSPWRHPVRRHRRRGRCAVGRAGRGAVGKDRYPGQQRRNHPGHADPDECPTSSGTMFCEPICGRHFC